MTSFPHSLSTTLVQSCLEKASIELLVITTTIPSTQPSFEFFRLSVTLTKVPNTSFVDKQVPPSSSLTKQQQGIPVVSVISKFVVSPSISTIVSIPNVSIASTMIVENQYQSISKVLDKGGKFSTILKEK